MLNSWTFLAVIRKRSLSSKQDSMRLKCKTDSLESILLHTHALLNPIENRHGHFCRNPQRLQKHKYAEGAEFYYVNTNLFRSSKHMKYSEEQIHDQTSPFVYGWSSDIIKMFLTLSCINLSFA